MHSRTVRRSGQGKKSWRMYNTLRVTSTSRTKDRNRGQRVWTKRIPEYLSLLHACPMTDPPAINKKTQTRSKPSPPVVSLFSCGGWFFPHRRLGSRPGEVARRWPRSVEAFVLSLSRSPWLANLAALSMPWRVCPSRSILSSKREINWSRWLNRMVVLVVGLTRYWEKISAASSAPRWKVASF